MKNKIFILSVFVFLAISFKSNSQNWQWANKIGGTNSNSASVYSVDNNNNYYVAGKFSGYIFLPNDTLVSAGLDDGLIIKYDTNGNTLWAKNIGGNNTTFSGEILSVAIDNTDNYLIAVGTFFGALTIGVNTISSSGNSDIFIAKFDLNGNCIWLKKAGGVGLDVASAFTFDSNNDIFITGKVADTAFFDAISIPAGGFFGKYNLNGACISAEIKYSNLDIVEIESKNNTIILSGNISDTTVSIDTITITANQSSVFLAKIDNFGNASWFKLYGGAEVYGTAIDLDNQSNIYFTGFFSTNITFSGITISQSGGAGSKDIFVSKLDINGNAIWVNQSNSTFTAYANGISSDLDGNVYVSGFIGGSAQFGQFNITANGNSDFFLARYNTTGDCLGIRHFGTATSGLCLTDNNNNVIVGGQFIDTITIGSQSLTATTNNTPDLFIAKADEITGLGEEGRAKNNQLLIYANPNQGKCTINVPDDFLNERNLTLSIYDNTGKLIQQKTLLMNEGKIKLNLEQEAKGIYNVVLTNNVKSYYGKIVFE